MSSDFGKVRQKKTKSGLIRPNKDVLRQNLNRALIEKLKALYGSEKWKYKVQKEALNAFGVKIQYHQLNAFEEGKTRSTNFLVMILMVLISKMEVFDIHVEGMKIEVKDYEIR